MEFPFAPPRFRLRVTGTVLEAKLTNASSYIWFSVSSAIIEVELSSTSQFRRCLGRLCREFPVVGGVAEVS
jgi:hypothetical protein